MASNVQFQIKRGKKSALSSAQKILGCWYLTTDTNEVFVCNDGETLAPLISGGVSTFSSTSELPLVGNESIVYFIVNDSGISAYRWTNDGAKYVKLLDNTVSINVIHGGSSVDPETQFE